MRVMTHMYVLSLPGVSVWCLNDKKLTLSGIPYLCRFCPRTTNHYLPHWKWAATLRWMSEVFKMNEQEVHNYCGGSRGWQCDRIVSKSEKMMVDTQLKINALLRTSHGFFLFLYFLWQLWIFKVSSSILKTFTSSAVETVLTGSISAWYGNC